MYRWGFASQGWIDLPNNICWIVEWGSCVSSISFFLSLMILEFSSHFHDWCLMFLVEMSPPWSFCLINEKSCVRFSWYPSTPMRYLVEDWGEIDDWVRIAFQISAQNQIKNVDVHLLVWGHSFSSLLPCSSSCVRIMLSNYQRGSSCWLNGKQHDITWANRCSFSGSFLLLTKNIFRAVLKSPFQIPSSLDPCCIHLLRQ